MNDRREVVGGREGWKCVTPLFRFEISISHLLGDAAFSFLFFSFLFWLCRAACRILVPPPGIEPGPLAVKVLHPNHWTAREFPNFSIEYESIAQVKMSGLEENFLNEQ